MRTQENGSKKENPTRDSAGCVDFVTTVGVCIVLRYLLGNSSHACLSLLGRGIIFFVLSCLGLSYTCCASEDNGERHTKYVVSGTTYYKGGGGGHHTDYTAVYLMNDNIGSQILRTIFLVWISRTTNSRFVFVSLFCS